MGKRKNDFLEQKWSKLTGLIFACASLIGVGFYCGDYKASIQCDKEQIKLIQEYNEKTVSEENLCKTQTILGIKKEMQEIKEVTNYIIQNKSKNEK